MDHRSAVESFTRAGVAGHFQSQFEVHGLFLDDDVSLFLLGFGSGNPEPVVLFLLRRVFRGTPQVVNVQGFDVQLVVVKAHVFEVGHQTVFFKAGLVVKVLPCTRHPTHGRLVLSLDRVQKVQIRSFHLEAAVRGRNLKSHTNKAALL